MNIRSFIPKVGNRIAGLCLRNDQLYQAFLTFAKKGTSQKLLTYSDAYNVLKNASPCPPSESPEALERLWPKIPTVDVSVIVPCFNVEKYLRKCICSISNQITQRSFEIIAIDDGSTDSTADILSELSHKDKRIRVIHQTNEGLSGARNTGIAAAHGRLLMFVDSDDCLLPLAIDTLCDVFDNTSCDFVTASYMNMSEDGRRIMPLHGRRTHGAPWARLYSREVWRHLEFPEHYWFEDTVQNLCIEPCWRSTYCDKAVYLYRQNSSGISKRAGDSKKGLDTFWIIGELLEWNTNLGTPFSQEMYERVLRQLGPLSWERTIALNKKERIALFVCERKLLEQCREHHDYSCQTKSRWRDLEDSLIAGNYRMWCIAELGLIGWHE